MKSREKNYIKRGYPYRFDKEDIYYQGICNRIPRFVYQRDESDWNRNVLNKVLQQEMLNLIYVNFSLTFVVLHKLFKLMEAQDKI